MVLDGGKGVEPRTIALMDVCRLRDTPIVSFINKLDRDIRDPIELLDEIEAVLNIKAAPITWPIGCYKDFKGVYHLTGDYIIVYTRVTATSAPKPRSFRSWIPTKPAPTSATCTSASWKNWNWCRAPATSSSPTPSSRAK